MATRKEIKAAKKILAETWKAANALPRRDNEQPFNPSPGSFERYIAWCDRHDIKPSEKWAFDHYYQSRYIRSKYHPSGTYPNSIEKMESLLGPGTPVHVDSDASDYEKNQIRDSWWAVLRAYKPGHSQQYNYETKAWDKIPAVFKEFSQQIHIEYSVGRSEHSLMHWEIHCKAYSRVGYSLGHPARVVFTPGVASDLKDSFLDIVSVCDCRKIEREEEKVMTFSLVRYTYRKKRRRKYRARY